MPKKTWKASVITLFPEMFPGALGFSNVGKALEKGRWHLETFPMRNYATDKHQTVDDRPFGGGAGMVMRPDIISRAVDDVLQRNKRKKPRLIYFSPRGKVIRQTTIEELAGLKHVVFLCGRYEGVDQRLLDKYGFEELSLGDFILSGGEIAAMAVIDACVRRLSGVLGNAFSHAQESFGDGEFSSLLEYPHYTRPAAWEGMEVPEVLFSGDHAKIEKWRRARSEEITKVRRPELWAIHTKNKKDLG